MQTDVMQIDVTRIMEEYGLDKLQKELSALFPRWQFSLEELFGALLKGDLQECFRLLKEGIFGQLSLEFSSLRNVFISLLLIGLLSALLSNLSDVFSSKQIADISFYFSYLFMVILLLNSFEQAAEIVGEMTEDVVLFMKLFLPTYSVTMGLAAGGVTAGVMYEMLLLLVYIIELGISAVLLPAIYGYVFLNLVNGLWKEERLTLLMEGIKKSVAFLLKAITTAVMGISIIQSMITPIIDSLKGEAVQRAVSVIPGLGNLAGGVTEMMVGSAVLIKNSVGTCMLLLLIFMCLLPICKLLCIVILLKGAAALMGLAADKRMTGCTDRMGEGCILLFRTAVTMLTLFIITIAIISYTTNRGF